MSPEIVVLALDSVHPAVCAAACRYLWTRLAFRYSTCLAPACLSQARPSDRRSTFDSGMGRLPFTCEDGDTTVQPTQYRVRPQL
jgi:hypothetical protein